MSPDPDQSLRLLKAFTGVQDDKAREEIIALVESIQRGTRVPPSSRDELNRKQ